jgi:hypothetical protein
VEEPQRWKASVALHSSVADATKAAICIDCLGFPARSLACHHLPTPSVEHRQTNKCDQGQLNGRNQSRATRKGRTLARAFPFPPLRASFRPRAPHCEGLRGTVEYIHMNPVNRGLVERPEQWKWSSLPEYASVDAAEEQSRCGLTMDRVSRRRGTRRSESENLKRRTADLQNGSALHLLMAALLLLAPRIYRIALRESPRMERRSFSRSGNRLGWFRGARLRARNLHGSRDPG